MLPLTFFIFLSFAFSLYFIGNLKNMHGAYSILGACLIILIGFFLAFEGIDYKCGYVENSTVTNITTVTHTYCQEDINIIFWVWIIMTGIIMFVKETFELKEFGVKKQ